VDRDRDPMLANVLRGQYPIHASLGRARRNHTSLENALVARVRRVRCQIDKCSENRDLARRSFLNRVFDDDMKRNTLFEILPFQSRSGDRCTGQHSDRGNAHARRAGTWP